MDPLAQLGINKQSKANFAQLLFYFLRECHNNPLDERYIIEIKWKRWFWKVKKPYIEIIKKGLSIPMFNALMTEMKEHYKREAAEMKKSRRR